MTNLVLFVLLVSGSRSSVLGIPTKADMVSWDIVGVQAGIGFYEDYDMTLFSAGASLLRGRLYWGKTFAFSAGLELLRFHYSYGRRLVEYDDGYGPDDLYSIPVNLIHWWVETELNTWELFSPQVGIAWLGKPLPSCCLSNNSLNLYHSPRLELVTGLSLLNVEYYEMNPILLSTIRTEVNFIFTRQAFLQFEHRWFPFYDTDNLGNRHSLALSLCLSIGWDNALR